MVRLERETQDLREAVFHVEQPDNDAQDAQHARLPDEPQSYKIGHGWDPPDGRRSLWSPAHKVKITRRDSATAALADRCAVSAIPRSQLRARWQFCFFRVNFVRLDSHPCAR